MRFMIGLLATLALGPVAHAQDFREFDGTVAGSLDMTSELREDRFAEAAYDTARQLANTLERLADQADRVADQAQRNGNVTRARRFNDLSNRADTLGNEVERRVVAALTRGDRNRARNQLQALGRHFQYLDQAYRTIAQVPANVAQSAQRVRTLHQQLQRQLAGGGGGGGGFWQCTAVDQGWEEHPGGHSANGTSYQQAQRRALDLCERAHGRCVISRCNQGRNW